MLKYHFSRVLIPKSSASYFLILKNQFGSALPIVLFFSSFALVAVVAFLFHQFTNSKQTLHRPAELQAVANARSGIYKAIQLLQDSSKTSTVEKTQDFTDTSFTKGLFDPVKDTGIELTDDSLKFNGTFVKQILYSVDTFGECEIALNIDGSSILITSVGSFRNYKKRVVARLASKIPALPDTVLILDNNYPINRDPNGVVIRTVDNGAGAPTPPQGTGDSTKQNSRQEELLTKFLEPYTELFNNEQDTLLFDTPLIIQSNQTFKKIPEKVNGALLIDGTNFDLKWIAEKPTKITVLGDLQITGTVYLENINFIVGGEVKIFDETECKNISIYSNNRIFIGNKAKFQGSALTPQKIIIYNDAFIYGKSSLIATGKSSTSSTSKTDSSKFSINIHDQAVVDGVCIALNNPGGVRIDSEAKVTGVIWADNVVSHSGKLNGLIKAKQLIDINQNLVNQSENNLPGTINPLQNIEEYEMPFFLGSFRIVQWKEMNESDSTEISK